MNLSRTILKLFGWTVKLTVPDYPKCIICVAPHTSNWDFVIGELAIASVGRKAGFLMKESWFLWPLGPIFRSLGGVPVPRRRKNYSLVEVLVERFKRVDHLVLAVTPEGTRSRTDRWHTGFLEIARQADVPIALAAIDFKTKCAQITETFVPTGDNEADLCAIKAYYSKFTGLHNENFSTDPQ